METQKITIEKLVPYLPYGLQMHNIHNGNTFELKGIYDEGDFSIRNMVYVFKGERSHYNLLKVNFKPLLIHLNNINDQQWTEIFRVGFINIGHEVWPIGESFIERHANAIEIVYAGKSATYDFVNKQFETRIFAFNQKVAFEKIYEYHGDIDFLIEAGLALDKLDY